MTLGAFRALPDDERDEMLAASELVCSCGNLRSVCSDPDVDWHPQESVCYAAGTLAWGIRRLQAQNKDFDPEAKDVNGEPVMSPLDGVTVWVSDIDIESLSKAASQQDDHQGDESN